MEARIADVAERGGTSAPLVLYYFESKDRLLNEALAFAEDRFYLAIFAELTDLETAGERLVRLIEFTCGHESAADLLREDLALWIGALVAGAPRRSGRPQARRPRPPLAPDDRRYRSRRPGGGEFADIDADKFSMLLASLLDGMVLQHMLEDPEAGYERARDICVDLACRYLEFSVPDEATLISTLSPVAPRRHPVRSAPAQIETERKTMRSRNEECWSSAAACRGAASSTT